MNPKYQTMPALADDDRDALERSIRTHGIQVPIIVDENGDVIDGHHRKAIALYLGIDCPTIHELGKTEAEKVALSISLNKDRRQLTREQKREIIAASLKAEPEATDREHARRTGASHPTVAAVRSEMEQSGDVESFTTRTDSLGRQQPASKPVINIKTKETHSTETTESFDPATGESLEPSPDVTEYLNSDQSLQDRKYVTAFVKAMNDGWLQFDPERIARVADPSVIRQIELRAASVAKFAETVKRSRPGLRAL